MKQIGKIILNWLAVFLWMAMIYYFSDQPNLKSELAPLWDTILRKLAHMAEFFVLAFLLFKAYRGNALPVGRALLFSGLVAIGYAFADEYHQSRVEGRVGSPTDVMIDSAGVLAFLVLQVYQYKKLKS